MTNAFLSVGFRPFYLGAAGFALLSLPLWILSYSQINAHPPSIAPVLWHSHEMIFGFASAVIAGFLLTAVRNWTGLPTPAGASLGMLFGLWLAARVANWFGPGVLAVLLDGGFLLALTICLSLPIARSSNRRNYFVGLLLLGLTTAAVLHGLSIRGICSLGNMGASSTAIAMDLILLLMIIIGGRVIPAFSRNAISGLTPRTWLPLEIGAIGSALALLAADLLAPAAGGTGWIAHDIFCTFAASLHLLRLALWQPWRTIQNPLLLALPMAYLWIPVHFLLLALQPQLALHALTVGAMASLMLAMMTRSALGHSGRPLAARAPELISFSAIHLAALARVAGPIIAPASYQLWLWLAAGLWSVAFGAFFLAYWPILTQPRADAQIST